jgi:hypothetical protein
LEKKKPVEKKMVGERDSCETRKKWMVEKKKGMTGKKGMVVKG